MILATVSAFWVGFASLSFLAGLFSIGGGLVLLVTLIRICFLQLTDEQKSSMVAILPIVIADNLFNLGALVGIYKSIAFGAFIWQYLFYPPAFLLLIVSYIVFCKLIVQFFIEYRQQHGLL